MRVVVSRSRVVVSSLFRCVDCGECVRSRRETVLGPSPVSSVKKYDSGKRVRVLPRGRYPSAACRTQSYRNDARNRAAREKEETEAEEEDVGPAVRSPPPSLESRRHVHLRVGVFLYNGVSRLVVVVVVVVVERQCPGCVRTARRTSPTYVENLKRFIRRAPR